MHLNVYKVMKASPYRELFALWSVIYCQKLMSLSMDETTLHQLTSILRLRQFITTARRVDVPDQTWLSQHQC